MIVCCFRPSRFWCVCVCVGAGRWRARSGVRFLLDAPCEFFAPAVDVDVEEPGAAVLPGVLVLVDHGPDDLAVGVGEWEVGDLVGLVPAEFSLVHVAVDDFDGLHDAVVEEEPVCLSLKGGLGDEPDKSEVVDVDMDAGFFHDLALGALGRRFAQVHLEFAADGGAETLVWCLDAVEEEDASVLVSQVAEAGDLVGENGFGGVVGHGQG